VVKNNGGEWAYRGIKGLPTCKGEGKKRDVLGLQSAARKLRRFGKRMQVIWGGGGIRERRRKKRTTSFYKESPYLPISRENEPPGIRRTEEIPR